MILWEATKSKFGDNITTKDRVIVACDGCGGRAIRVLCSVKQSMKKNGGKYYCHGCATKSKAFKDACSKRAKEKWKGQAYRENNLTAVRSNEYRERKRRESSERWQDEEFRSFMMSPEMRALRKSNSSKAIKKKWADPEYRSKLLRRLRERMLHKWRDEDYRNHMIEILSDRAVEMWESGAFIGSFGDEFREKMSKVNAEILSRPEVLQKLSDASKENWKRDEYRSAIINGNRKRWEDPDYREKMSKVNAEILSRPEVLQKLSDASKENWKRDEYRNAVIDGNRKRWEDPDYREKMAKIRADQPRISSLQNMLYGFLDDLGVEFFVESDATTIGYYVFDCLIPKQGTMHCGLLVECQGDYWHSLPEMEPRDRAKFSYISRYFPEYEIMYLWEHEFYTDGRVLDRLKLKLGIDVETVDFQFSDVEIIDNLRSDEVGAFLNSYHYIGRGRGGITYGARYNNKLIAVAVFSPPLRQNHQLHGDFRELSRFCIHPLYHKKNFASWFLSRTIKLIDVPRIVAYSDSTVGHDGGLYRASNFKLLHEVPPDYWYVDSSGYVMHKRTLYGRAKKMGMKESEFAERFGYYKKFGGPKKCYIYDKRPV